MQRLFPSLAAASLAAVVGASSSAAVIGGNPFPSISGSTFQLTDDGITATFTLDTADGNDTNDSGSTFTNNTTQSPGIGLLGIIGGAGGPRIGGDESFTITFDQDVYLLSVAVNADNGGLRFYDGGSIDLSATSTASFDANTVLTAGSALFVSAGRGGFESITVALVPEPASLALLGLGAVAIAAGRRRTA